MRYNILYNSLVLYKIYTFMIFDSNDINHTIFFFFFKKRGFMCEVGMGWVFGQTTKTKEEEEEEEEEGGFKCEF